MTTKEKPKKSTSTTKWTKTTKRYVCYIDWFDKPNLVETTTYSDSIVIYSANDDRNSLDAIICTIAGLTQDLLSEGIPFKGALSAGLMTYDKENSIYFGQPLIDSYLLQEELHYYGIIVHGSAQEKIEEYEYMSFMHEYNCPLKKGKSKHLTIAPIYLSLPIKRFEKHDTKLINSVNSMKFTTSGHLRIYVDSTIDYIKTIKSKIQKNE